MLWKYGPPATLPSVGLLLLRLVAGAGLMVHGWPKIQNPFGWNERFGPLLSSLSALAEFGGGLALVLGLFTPLFAILVAGNMAVAAWTHIERGQPFVGRGGSYELPALYLAIALLFLFAGPGKYAVDWLLFGRRTRPAE